MQRQLGRGAFWTGFGVGALLAASAVEAASLIADFGHAGLRYSYDTAAVTGVVMVDLDPDPAGVAYLPITLDFATATATLTDPASGAWIPYDIRYQSAPFVLLPQALPEPRSAARAADQPMHAMVAAPTDAMLVWTTFVSFSILPQSGASLPSGPWPEGVQVALTVVDWGWSETSSGAIYAYELSPVPLPGAGALLAAAMTALGVSRAKRMAQTGERPASREPVSRAKHHERIRNCRRSPDRRPPRPRPCACGGRHPCPAGHVTPPARLAQ